MQHVQGFIISFWTLSSGNYSPCIALEATRFAGKTTTMKNTPSLLAIPLAMAVRWYNTVHITLWRRFMAFLEATGCCHWVSFHPNNIKGTYQRFFFRVIHYQIVEKGQEVKGWPRLTIGV
jgi:hypothetical protein